MKAVGDTGRLDAVRPIHYVVAIAAMIIIVVASNVLVQYPINPWLTWGALTYPVSFLVSDLLNRRFGPITARKVALWGFVAALVVSAWLATPRIAVASGLAFLIAQLADIYVFDRLRHGKWWTAPFVGGIAGAAVDTFIFFCIAFVGTDMPWQTLMLGDFTIKILLNTFMLAPFRALMWNLARPKDK